MLNIDRRKTIAEMNSVGTHCTRTVESKENIPFRTKFSQHSANSTSSPNHNRERLLQT